MIDYNKFFAKCAELGVSGHANLTLHDGAESLHVSVFHNHKCYHTASRDDYFLQSLECFYRCKEL